MMIEQEDWVLCRVFHKGKGENNSNSNNNILNPRSMYEIGVNTCPNMDQSHALPYAAGTFSQRPVNHHQSQNQSSYLQLMSQEMKEPLSSNDQMAEDDDYGFLLDMNFEDPNLQNDSSIGNMRFDDENSLVFI